MGIEVVAANATKFPEQILVALREQPQDFRKRVFIYTLGKLYEAGRISGGFGAMMLGPLTLPSRYRLPGRGIGARGANGKQMAQSDAPVIGVVNRHP